MLHTLSDLPGLRVGCAQDAEKMTGVTVLLCPEGTVGGIDLRGSATSTRQCDSLQAGHMVSVVHAVCLAGGSAFGLDCAAGVLRFLAQRGKGLNVGFRTVPIVPTAALFDCALGDHEAFPAPDMAYEACEKATDSFPSGSHGAGCGASVGKVLGIGQAMKGGQGFCLVRGQDGLVVAAMTAVNAYGDIVDPQSGAILAGVRSDLEGERFADALKVLAQGRQPVSSFSKSPSNTVLSVIVTNAGLDKSACCRVAKMAHCGLARVVRPAHSVFDGDVAIALSAGKVAANENTVGALGAKALEGAVLDAVTFADGFGRIPDLNTFLSDEREGTHE